VSARVSVFGLGYVGSVMAACLARAGHDVRGVDINPAKVAAINEGRSAIVEPGLDEAIAEGRRTGRLTATTDPFDAVLGTDVSVVSVGTPGCANGALDLRAATAVTRQIGRALRRKSRYHCVVFRSTVLPGTVRNVLVPVLSRASQKRAHCEFDVCFNPEFMREGSALSDYQRPAVVVIGAETERGGDCAARLYDGIAAPVERTTYEAAEMLKYACNGFHALKVTFANEIGVLCKSLGIDSYRVMELFTRDDRLNISPAYLRPGFAFGGSCLGKDLRALLHQARELDLATPVLSATLDSNRQHIQRAVDWVLSWPAQRVGLIGLTFKGGTDDLRESPSVAVAEALLGKGRRLRIYDADLLAGTLVGANKAFIDRQLPHLSAYLCGSIDDVLRESDVLVICKADGIPPASLAVCVGAKPTLDLARVMLDGHATPANYEGICWPSARSSGPGGAHSGDRRRFQTAAPRSSWAPPEPHLPAPHQEARP
jgi:GDP-mannose 6-dehydrogenase